MERIFFTKLEYSFVNNIVLVKCINYMILPKTKSRLSKEEEEEIEKNPNMTET